MSMPTSKSSPGRFAVRVLKWLGAAALVLALLVGAGWAFIEWRFGMPSETDAVPILLRLQDEATPPGAPEDDAWPLYRTIITEDLEIPDLHPGWHPRRGGILQRLYDIEMPAADMSHINPLGGDWNDPVLAPVRELITDAQRLLARFDEAAARPVCRFPIVNEGDPLTGRYNPAVTTPYSKWSFNPLGAPMRQMQSIALWSMRDLANRSDWDAVQRRAASLIAFGNHLGMGYGGLTLFGIVPQRLALREVWLLAHEHRADEATLLDLIAFVESVAPARPLQHVFKERLLAIPSEVAQSLPAFEITDPETWADAWRQPRPRALARDLARLTRYAAEEIERPRLLRSPAPVSLPAGYGLHAVSEMMLDSWDTTLMARRAALIGLYIELFERRHGRLPHTLEEALPDMALADLGGGMTLGYDPAPTDLAPYQIRRPRGFVTALERMGYMSSERFAVLTNGRQPAFIPGWQPPQP